jgi:hypothetical protein
VIADLDTLLIALYVELTDRIIPSLGLARSGLGKPPEVTDAELGAGQRGNAAADGRHPHPVRPVQDHREAL